MRRLWRIPALLALPLLLGGCFRIEMAIHVDDDGSGTMAIVMALQEDMLALAEGDEMFPTLPGEVDRSQLPPGARVDEYSSDDFQGVRIEFPFTAGDDVARSIDRAMAGLGSGSETVAGEDTGFEQFVLQREDDGWRFQAALEDTSESPSGDQLDGVDEAIARALLKDASFRIRLKLPGRVTEHDADEVGSDGELIWNLDILNPGRTLSARSTSEDASGGSFAGVSTGVAAVAALAVILLTLLGGAALRRRLSADAGGNAPGAGGPGAPV